MPRRRTKTKLLRNLVITDSTLQKLALILQTITTRAKAGTIVPDEQPNTHPEQLEALGQLIADVRNSSADLSTDGVELH